ncbi:uncharacterized protein LOC144919599 [Branchiostoma floridae x Branchiostoma belcheri]
MASAPSIAPREDSSGGYDVESLHSLGSEYQSTHTNFSQDCDEAIYREWGRRPKSYDSDQGTPQGKRRADQGTPQEKHRAEQLGTPQAKRAVDQGSTPQGKRRSDQGSRRGQMKPQASVSSIENLEETKIEVVEEPGAAARAWRSAAGRVIQEGRRRSRLDRRRVRRMSRVEEGVLKKLLPKDEESDWCVRGYLRRGLKDKGWTTAISPVWDKLERAPKSNPLSLRKGSFQATSTFYLCGDKTPQQ